MGGGSSRSRITPRDLTRLQQVARERLRAGDRSTKRNVFISFAAEDLNDVNLLRAQAKNENSDIEFNDWSLREPFDSQRASYIRSGIRDRIEKSSVTLVYLSTDAARSSWVNWEIQESIDLGKGVIAVHKGDAPPRRLPAAITDNNIPIIRWTQTGLAEAIENASTRR